MYYINSPRSTIRMLICKKNGPVLNPVTLDFKLITAIMGKSIGWWRSQPLDPCGLKPLSGFNHVELDTLVLLKRPESISINGAVVHEYVTFTFSFDESVALVLIEPLYFTVWHYKVPPLNVT